VVWGWRTLWVETSLLVRVVINPVALLFGRVREGGRGLEWLRVWLRLVTDCKRVTEL
jgi:hypothetical protein